MHLFSATSLAKRTQFSPYNHVVVFRVTLQVSIPSDSRRTVAASRIQRTTGRVNHIHTRWTPTRHSDQLSRRSTVLIVIFIFVVVVVYGC